MRRAGPFSPFWEGHDTLLSETQVANDGEVTHFLFFLIGPRFWRKECEDIGIGGITSVDCGACKCAMVRND